MFAIFVQIGSENIVSFQLFDTRKLFVTAAQLFGRDSCLDILTPCWPAL